MKSQPSVNVPEYPQLTELAAGRIAAGVPAPDIIRALRAELRKMNHTPIQVNWGARFHFSKGVRLWRQRLRSNT